MTWSLDQLYCIDLPTQPNPSIGKTLVTGATGYIGGRLVTELLERGYDVRVMVRSGAEDYKERWPKVEIVEADALRYDELLDALKGVSVAYYLIHSLLLGKKEFHAADITAAANFRMAADFNGVKRIIYLGGLGDKKKKDYLSEHLRSRIQVARELSKGNVPVTILRAAIIIGSGSASFDIVKNLVKRAPILFIPKWGRTACQPISVRDTIKYLVGTLEKEETTGRSFDIGGMDQLSYKEMMKRLSAIMGKKRIILNSPLSSFTIYGYIASILTPVPARIIRALFEGCAHEVLCINNEILDIMYWDRLTYSEAVVFALDREEQDKISTSWAEAYPPAHELSIKLTELPEPKFKSAYSVLSNKSEDKLFAAICKVGGVKGWFHNNWMWRLRGLIDKILLGVGTSRGRRSYSNLRVNDVIDFWRVEDLEENKRLLLRAEMLLPGKAWLEFNIDSVDEHRKLTVKAYFHHKGFFGRMYWYAFLPFHYVIFKGLIKKIEQKS